MRNSLVFHAFCLARPSQLSITSGQAGSEFLDDHHALSIGFLIAAASTSTFISTFIAASWMVFS
jgi:hypothetical protein